MTSHPQLNEEQNEAFKALKKLIEHPAADTFVLKGYAGTGKTFLMQHLARWLKKNEIKVTLLASTGRAATVLRGKTGLETSTVHGELYRFAKVDGDEEGIPDDAPMDKYGQMTLQFGLRAPDEESRLYIIDEASMLSTETIETSSVVTFGTGNLLLDFFQAVNRSKVIFVGDPGQLPPVGQDFSPALDMDWLAEQGRIAVSMTLQQIERQGSDNDILLLSSAIRNMHENLDPAVKYPKIPAKGLNSVDLYESDTALLDSYIDKYKEVGPGAALAIARSNRKVSEICRAVRESLYGDGGLPLQVGEVLIVVQNNYAVPLSNGDFVTVSAIGETRLKENLQFQNIRVKSLISDEEYDVLLSLDVLYGNEAGLSNDQSRRLMVDFSRRMRKLGVKPNSGDYKAKMLKDDYLNCLKAKYGYAVTCHKAQGGEWNDVFLFVEKSMYGMPREEFFRWWYTAVTRAKQRLHLTEDWWISSRQSR